MIRVWAGSRSSLVRSALESLIRTSSCLEFAGSVDPAHLSASAMAAMEQSGDVLLVEVADPSESVWRMLAELPLPTLVLLETSETAVIAAMLQAGIRGVLQSDATAEELEGAVSAVHAGLIVMTPAGLEEVLPDMLTPGEELPEPVSARELEVLALLVEGLSNKTIAYRLSISEHTVKTHVASVFGKLGVSSRTEAASQAIRRGLVML